MNDLLKQLGWRFLRGFTVGALGAITILTPFVGSSLNEFGDWLFLGVIALAFGGFNGGLLAVGKFLREKGIMNLPF